MAIREAMEKGFLLRIICIKSPSLTGLPCRRRSPCVGSGGTTAYDKNLVKSHICPFPVISIAGGRCAYEK